MVSIATTQLSCKGQVIIPEEIRTRLGLKAGSRFVVLGEAGTIIFKKIEPPDPNEFAALLKRMRTQARKAGLRRKDIAAATRRVRRGRQRA